MAVVVPENAIAPASKRSFRLHVMPSPSSDADVETNAQTSPAPHAFVQALMQVAWQSLSNAQTSPLRQPSAVPVRHCGISAISQAPTLRVHDVLAAESGRNEAEMTGDESPVAELRDSPSVIVPSACGRLSSSLGTVLDPSSLAGVPPAFGSPVEAPLAAQAT